MCKKTITSEYVSYAHPDKIADAISDAILDEFLKQDSNAKTGIETLVKDNIVVLGGEVSSTATVNYEEVVRNVFKNLPFSKEHHLAPNEIKIINLIGKQSTEIHNGVDKGKGIIGAGDQGFMVGYASNETYTYMPLGHYLAKKICQYIASLTPLYGPDTKSQVTVEYDENNIPTVKHILISTMHQNSLDNCRNDITKYISNNEINISQYIFDNYIKNNNDLVIDVNPCGEWRTGGPVSDCGVTGRKIVVDAYGGYCNVGGGAFCVDGDSEYVGEDLKWHKISEYRDGKVGQWNNGILEFVEPINYIRQKAEKMYHFHSPYSIDMVLSEHHNMVALTSKKNLYKIPVYEVINKINDLKTGFKDSIPVTFEYYNNSNGVDLTDDEIRLQVAYCAEGTSDFQSNGKGRINVRKKYKVERLEWLLNRTNTQYTSNIKGEYLPHYYYFNPPIASKSLYSIFKNANFHQMAIIANEVMRWDGDKSKLLFRTTNKEDADFIQFIFSIVYNSDVSILIDDRIGRKCKVNDKEYETKTKCYTVQLNQRKTISFGGLKSKISIEKYNADLMYCFTVPSGMLLLRRNNSIFVTGNCGKDSSKVDRSAAYMCRYLAKNIVATGICNTAKVELSYMIGIPEPSAINVELDINNDKADKIIEWIKSHIDLTPKGIIERFDGLYPRYYNTAINGHYGYNVNGNEELEKLYPWEKIDIAKPLQQIIKQ